MSEPVSPQTSDASPTAVAPITAARSNESMRVMGAKVRVRRGPRHPNVSHSRRLRVAVDLNVSVATADKLLYGETAVNRLYAMVIESDLRAGDHEAVAHWIAPADAALLDSDVPGLLEAWSEYDAADCAEDVAQSPLNHRDPAGLTNQELDAYARSVARELYRGTRYLASLRRVQQRRKA